MKFSVYDKMGWEYLSRLGLPHFRGLLMKECAGERGGVPFQAGKFQLESEPVEPDEVKQNGK